MQEAGDANAYNGEPHSNAITAQHTTKMAEQFCRKNGGYCATCTPFGVHCFHGTGGYIGKKTLAGDKP